MANSFLDSAASGKKILAIVPHEDDEINVAGSMLYVYAQKGAEVYCVFTTNGDYSFWAKTRITEAVRSLQVLGVQHVYFLGYGDTSNNYPGGHLFNALTAPVTSPAGHQETYGTIAHPDYAWQKKKRHSPYDRQHFKEDLRDVILDVTADIIFCVDCDYHADHRAASLLFEEVMGEILQRPGNTYMPLVFKTFAYCLAFGASKDFYADNILSLPKPANTKDNLHANTLIDVSLYDWQRRVRFPVPKGCRGHFLRHNVLYRALFQHKSQAAGLHAIQLANGDAVYWQKRSDNLACQAKVTASSGKAEKVHDFKLLDLVSLKEKTPLFTDYYWQPQAADTEKRLIFTWNQPQDIAFISLWGILGEKQIKSLTLTFDTGYACKIGPLPANGRELKRQIPLQRGVHQCSLRILQAEGDYGLSEVGFYQTERQTGEVPFIKIQIDGQFAYDYVLPEEQRICQLSTYLYGRQGKVKYSLPKTRKSHVDINGLVHLAAGESAVVVRAEIAANPEIYDEIILYRVSETTLKKLRLKQQLEKAFLTFYLKKYRKYIHIKHKYLKTL